MAAGDEAAIDGSGATLGENAHQLASKLRLDEAQTDLLVSELRNALVPVELASPSRGVRRILALADELAKRHGRSGTVGGIS